MCWIIECCFANTATCNLKMVVDILYSPVFLLICSGCVSPGLYTCDDSRIRPTDPKLSHWGAPPSGPPMVHHSILHHQAPPAGESTYDTLSLESSDSVETSVSTGNNSACSPERWDAVVKGTLHSASIPLTTGHAVQFPHKCFFILLPE